MRGGTMRHALGWMCVAWLATAGCAVPTTAIVDGRVVPRLTLQYTDGRFFKLVHEGVHPAAIRPSSGVWADGGRITGRVCGTDLVYDVWHSGHSDYITGFITRATGSSVQFPVKLVIEDTR